MSEPKKTVLLVDDEEQTLRSYALLLQGSGLAKVRGVSDSREVLPLLSRGGVSVILLDLHMPHISGLELLPRIVRDYPQVPVLLLTANDDVQTVVSCMKEGAFDYLVKPVDANRLSSTVKKALEHTELSTELSSLKEALLSGGLEHPAAFSAIVTASRKMHSLFRYVEVVAPTRQPVLVTGETGVGKELMARAIHQLSGVKGAFVALNAAGLDDNLFSDTLFGHKRGAYTGADQAREGLIARAAGGTLFLDEIGDLHENSQIKLLRLLQEGEYYPVGSDLLKKSDARIVLATNRDLKKAIGSGRFRNDLYYRLCTHLVHIPALRERREDLPLLLNHFIERTSAEMKTKPPGYPKELLDLLGTHHFPGNVRELEAMVQDAVARSVSSKMLSQEPFRRVISETRSQGLGPAPAQLDEERVVALLEALFGSFPTLEEAEDLLINTALSRARGNQGIAATMLGLKRQTLNMRLKVRKKRS